MYSLVLMMALSNGAATPALHDGDDHRSVSHYGQNDHRQYRHRRGRCGCCGGGGGCYGGGGCSGGGWGGGCHGGGWGGGCHGGYAGGYGCTGGGYAGGCTGGYAGGWGGGYGYAMSSGYGGMSSGYAAYPGSYGGFATYPGTYSGYMSGYGDTGYTGGVMYPSGGVITGGAYPEGTIIEGTPVETSGTRSRPATGSDRRDRERGLDREPQGPDRSTPRNRDRDRDQDKEGMAPAPARIIVSLPADARLTVDGTPTKSTSATRVFVSPALQPGQQYQYTFKAEVVRNGEPQSATKQVTVRAGQETRVQFNLPAVGVAQK